mmetsp:Transcript_68641/g.155264  ORF Transcript_68641/g.155264 Transcript_68641/m.155264 type:complete len:267 (-) Transcript_68641:74-874(-)
MAEFSKPGVSIGRTPQSPDCRMTSSRAASARTRSLAVCSQSPSTLRSPSGRSAGRSRPLATRSRSERAMAAKVRVVFRSSSPSGPTISGWAASRGRTVRPVSAPTRARSYSAAASSSRARMARRSASPSGPGMGESLGRSPLMSPSVSTIRLARAVSASITRSSALRAAAAGPDPPRPSYCSSLGTPAAPSVTLDRHSASCRLSFAKTTRALRNNEGSRKSGSGLLSDASGAAEKREECNVLIIVPPGRDILNETTLDTPTSSRKG